MALWIGHYLTIYLLMQKRLAKEARAQEIQAKNAALGKKVKETPASKGIKGRGEASFYRVTCKVRMVSFSDLGFWHCIDVHCLHVLVFISEKNRLI